jgi:hypothetical protein
MCRASSPERFVGFFECLLPRQAEVTEPMRVVDELAQHRTLPLPSPQAEPSGPSSASRTA